MFNILKNYIQAAAILRLIKEAKLNDLQYKLIVSDKTYRLKKELEERGLLEKFYQAHPTESEDSMKAFLQEIQQSSQRSKRNAFYAEQMRLDDKLKTFVEKYGTHKIDFRFFDRLSFFNEGRLEPDVVEKNKKQFKILAQPFVNDSLATLINKYMLSALADYRTLNDFITLYNEAIDLKNENTSESQARFEHIIQQLARVMFAMIKGIAVGGHIGGEIDHEKELKRALEIRQTDDFDFLFEGEEEIEDSDIIEVDGKKPPKIPSFLPYAGPQSQREPPPVESKPASKEDVTAVGAPIARAKNR